MHAHDIQAAGAQAILTEQAGLDLLHQAMADQLGQAFAEAAALILSAQESGQGRVIVSGMGKSGHVGRKIAATLASTGTPAYFVHPAEASHGDLGMIQTQDVILALSWSGETSELSDLIAYAKRFRVPLIGITAHADSALARESKIVLVLPKATEACPNGIAPTTSTTMQMALGDALAVALLAARGFSSHDFRTFHPGGKLGAQLKQVRDLMHQGERLPLVRSGSLMSDALVEMSAKGFGCVLVVDHTDQLAGIITDGDLRRHMAGDLLSRTVDAVMTRAPRSVDPGILVAEALEIVETHKIGALIVTDQQKPVGIVHVLDLLRAGAA